MMLLAALLVPLGARATTDTLTVADGTETNSYVPIYGYWADAAQHNQMIYPASMLTDMIGQNITSLTFYVTGGWTSYATVSMAIVADSTLSGFNNAELTEVWSGDWNSSTVMTLTNAFPYAGGNLLIDIVTVGDNYNASTATGVMLTAASLNQYSTGSFNIRNFLPKATFVYSDEAFCLAPTRPALISSTTSSLTFGWHPGGSETSWQVMVGDSLIGVVSDTIVTVNDLNPSSRYAVSVRTICGAEDSSNWTSPVLMATSCAAITNLPWSNGFEGENGNEVPLCWTRTVPFAYTDYNDDTIYTPTSISMPPMPSIPTPEHRRSISTTIHPMAL
ncbi:MAG: hypothetical protein IJ634_02465 [Bacteroidales bacterium]|nr:hypothetical protein [Bacteroidales bacterium]